MKVLAFNGSPRKNGNTRRALEIVLEEISKEGIETELIDIADGPLAPCRACGACGRNKDGRCIIDDDPLNGWLEKMYAADGFLIGSPTYFGNMSAHTKAFIDRTGYVSRANGNKFARKVGAAVAVNRRAGALVTFQDINNLFLISQMVVPGSSYWNVITALDPGDIEKDEEGVKTMRTLGKNFAWLVKKLK
ncbi:MAG: flavodoxin family protein [Methanomassiliicoccales archaeon]|nr:MAG: flavodoxin family protein [Methanomassiliicoccales archaeon]